MITKLARRVRKTTVLVAAAVAAISVGALAAPGAALANANGVSGFGPCYMQSGICIPRGEMSIDTFSVGGSGNKISWITAGFNYAGQISNLWIDHNFYDAAGIRTLHLQGPEKYGNFSSASQSWTWGSGYYTAPRFGSHCATLYSQQPGGSIKVWKTVCNRIG